MYKQSFGRKGTQESDMNEIKYTFNENSIPLQQLPNIYFISDFEHFDSQNMENI